MSVLLAPMSPRRSMNSHVFDDAILSDLERYIKDNYDGMSVSSDDESSVVYEDDDSETTISYSTETEETDSQCTNETSSPIRAPRPMLTMRQQSYRRMIVSSSDEENDCDNEFLFRGLHGKKKRVYFDDHEEVLEFMVDRDAEMKSNLYWSSDDMDQFAMNSVIRVREIKMTSKSDCSLPSMLRFFHDAIAEDDFEEVDLPDLFDTSEALKLIKLYQSEPGIDAIGTELSGVERRVALESRSRRDFILEVVEGIQCEEPYDSWYDEEVVNEISEACIDISRRCEMFAYFLAQMQFMASNNQLSS